MGNLQNMKKELNCLINSFLSSFSFLFLFFKSLFMYFLGKAARQAGGGGYINCEFKKSFKGQEKYFLAQEYLLISIFLDSSICSPVVL